MFEYNKEENRDNALGAFLATCAFVDAYKTIILVLSCLCFYSLLTIFKLIDIWILRLVFSFLLARCCVILLLMFTTDRQYDVVCKKLNYPIAVKKLMINKNDEDNNIGNANPKIPGIDFIYEVKNKTADILALTLRADEGKYKVLGLVDCSEQNKDLTKKISSDILAESFIGLKKNLIYSDKCLIIDVVKLKRKPIDLEIIESKDIDNTLVLTECVYYPYIK